MWAIAKGVLYIVGGLLLIYFFIVIVRLVWNWSYNFGENLVENQKNGNTIESPLSNFSLRGLLEYWRPFTYPPLEVKKGINTGKYYYETEEGSFFKSPTVMNKLYWQGLNQAPNNHPTDYVPGPGFKGEWMQSSDGSTASKFQDNDNIDVYFTKGEVVSRNQVITGKAYYKFFKDRKFPVTVYNEDNKIISQSYAYINGEIASDYKVPFRVVLNFNPGYKQGYLKFESANKEESFDDIENFPIRFKITDYESLLKGYKETTKENSCVITGCSMQLCVSQEQAKNVYSTCEYQPHYACYKTAKCGFDHTKGACDRIVDGQLAQCLANSH